MKSLLTLAATALLLTSVASCKKDKTTALPTPTTPECSATIYGYFGPNNDSYYGSTGTYSFGTFNFSTAASTGIATINTHIRIGGGAYNTSDNCYYTIVGGSNSPTLCKVSTAGVVTYYSRPSGTYTYIGSLIYNVATNKLLVIQNDSSINKLSEIIIGSGTTYSVSPGVTIPVAGYVTEITCNPATGDVYAVGISTGVPYDYTLSRITATGATLVDSGSGAIRCLRYNTTDNMIYGLHYSSTLPYALVKINPTGGHTNLADLAINFNSDYYSTCLNECNGRYIVSTLKYDTAGSIWDETHGKIYQFDLSGTLLQQDNTPGMFQGLVVKY
ncbi:hypothetical protein CJD36_006455 [Flavipsychrobacter stenotrophus]|uniref:DUF4394 domain-containing protein n=1 Tax=Flavipsychrobacter stenotrophus TaxID=2077091 RepID=A0A2S7SWY2_9BACT|nr:hypothetical protein [Flavipsychrobacter stenotrophus]PQJ11439.1 hypothetical protein CJD36_006455 [Flavipsychrobacter stenotrophus]